MTDVDEGVVDEIAERGSNPLIEEVAALLERQHAHDEPGVSRETLDAYANALAANSEFGVDPEEFATAIDERLTGAERGAGDDALYNADGRISAYPPRWHAELGGSTGVGAYVSFVEREVAGHESDAPGGGAGEGVPEGQLVDTVATVGRVERERANEALEDARADGRIVEGPGQHPDGGEELADEKADRSDGE